MPRSTRETALMRQHASRKNGNAGNGYRDSWGLRPLPEELRKKYVSLGWWNDQSLGELLDSQLRSHEQNDFRIWSSSRPFQGTIGDVRSLARRLARGLEKMDVHPGDVVAFQLPNWVEAAITFYGFSMLGVVLVPIVHFYGPKEVGFILRESGARVFITAERFGHHEMLNDLLPLLGSLEELRTVIVVAEQPGSYSFPAGSPTPTTSAPPVYPGDLPTEIVDFPSLLDNEQLSAPARVDPSFPALIAYTSGTTSDPKGVIHTHRSLGFEVRQLSALQAARDRPHITGAPVGHGIGMLSGLLIPVYRGHPIHLIDVWNPSAVLAAMLEAGIAAGAGSTYFLTSLLDSSDLKPEHLKLMSKIGLGGSSVPAAVTERAERLGISIVRSYGSTEHPSTTGCTHDEPAPKRLYTDGKPLEGIEMRIVDASGRDVAPGDEGEILSRGPDRFLGYTDPLLSDEAIDADGWYSTGDIGMLDPDGYLVITDRKKDIIIRGGENVSAAEVEGLLAQIDGVAEVALVAAPDPRLGEHGCAFVRMSDGADLLNLDIVRSHLEKTGLARQKWPEEIRLVKDFPRTPSGKVKKFVLREELRKGYER